MRRLFIDTDLFVRKLRYPRDRFSDENNLFLEKVKTKKLKAATSIFNVLEVCGVLSFNLTEKALTNLYSGFAEHFGVKIFFPADEKANLQYDYVQIFERIRKKQSLGDAQVGWVVERFSNLISAFVSWNVRHFEGKFSVPVMTPEEFLKI